MSKKNQVLLRCRTCDREFSVKFSHASGRKYCSKACMNKMVHTWTSGKSSPKKQTERLKKSLEKHVIKNGDGCWGWKGTLDKNGYAKLSCSHTMGATRAHRASWLLNFGAIPAGFVIAHKCDVRHCTRPDHLIAVKPKYNSADMVLKDRQAKGSKNGSAKLTEHEVKQIKKDIKDGIPSEFIRILNDVSRDQFRRIKLGTHWKHVTLDDPKID